MTTGLLSADFFLLAGIGFVAQLIDGALGMAFGVISTSAMLALGVPPAQASAVVHTAEIFTTGASAVSHAYHHNVDRHYVLRLAIGGILGAILGAWLLSNIDSSIMRPIISTYLLLIGAFILLKSFSMAPVRDAPAQWLPPLGFTAGFFDATGGGGWGPITTSTLIGSGHAPRKTVGSVNATQFFVTVAATAVFFVELGATLLDHLIPLVIGGLLGAPFGGWMVKYIPARSLMVMVGLLVIILALWQFSRFFKVI